MGTVCSQRNESDKKITQPIYETLCENIEKRLVLSTLNIKDLEHEINEIEYKDGVFNAKAVVKLYTNHGVSEEAFYAIGSIYQELLSDLEECYSHRQYLLSTALPFCKGSTSEKKEVLWKILQPEGNYVECRLLRSVIKMLVVLCIKTIPEIVVKECEKTGERIVGDITTLANSENKEIKEYAAQYYPEEARKGEKGESTATSRRGEEEDKMFHRYAFDMWLAKIDAAGLLNSKSHREAFLKHLKEKRTPKG